MKKYNILYSKKMVGLCFGIAIPIWLIILIASLFSDILSYDILISFMPLAIALIIWLISLLRIVFAKRLFHEQIRKLNVQFEDNDVKCIVLSYLYVSHDWLIFCGKFFLHRNFIVSISIKPKTTSMGNDYVCVIKCINDKIYKVHLPSKSDGKAIQNWFK